MPDEKKPPENGAEGDIVGTGESDPPPDDPMSVREALVNPATFVEGMRAVEVWTQIVMCPPHYTRVVVQTYLDSKAWQCAVEEMPGLPDRCMIRCFNPATLRLVQRRFVNHLPKPWPG